MMPLAAKRPPFITAWPTRWMVAPTTAMGVATVKPAMTRPNCDTEEYASIRWTLDWETASAEPATMLTDATAMSAQRAAGTAVRKSTVNTENSRRASAYADTVETSAEMNVLTL